MDKGRLEAFSDGVIAIIITITALLIEPPKGSTFNDLKEILPLILVYTVSFIMIGTNWANHHHLLKITAHINGKVIWANHFYLFTLSFYPVATAWVGKTNFASAPTITYVAVNLIESMAFILVERIILSEHRNSSTHKLLSKGRKELATILLELAALVFAFSGRLRFVSYILLLAMTLLWIVPDLRMKRIFEETNGGES